MPDTPIKAEEKTSSKVCKTGKIEITLIWLARIALAAVFIFSGLSKAIDPWGFVYKLQEYTSVWDIDVSRSLLLCFAVLLSGAEFVCGVLVATGSLRRVALWGMGAMMAVMLPLTAYLAISNPVPDCGCFGDALPISNTATFIKNIVIVALIVWLWLRNRKVGGIIAPPLQWIAIIISLGFSVTISYIGYEIQPMVDFRPYKTGTSILGDGSDTTAATFVYEKDGKQQIFTTDNLPDDSWTFVERIENNNHNEHSIVFFDGNEEVAEFMLEPGTSTPTLLMLVPDPQNHDLSRSSSANHLHRYMTEELDGIMFAIVACHPDSIEDWRRHVGAQYQAFSAEDSMLKEIARGDASLVYLHGDTIMWKRNIHSLPPDFPPTLRAANNPSEEFEGNLLETIKPIDDNYKFLEFTLYYLIAMIILIGISRFIKQE